MRIFVATILTRWLVENTAQTARAILVEKNALDSLLLQLVFAGNTVVAEFLEMVLTKKYDELRALDSVRLKQ